MSRFVLCYRGKISRVSQVSSRVPVGESFYISDL